MRMRSRDKIRAVAHAYNFVIVLLRLRNKRNNFLGKAWLSNSGGTRLIKVLAAVVIASS